MAKRGQVRIIAGKWRRQHITIPSDGIRPTTDRVRETLFNWLASDLEGSRCLDLFTGSGALGLEALSRGAEFVHFVDKQRVITDHLHRVLEDLAPQDGVASHAKISCQAIPCEHFIHHDAFDIVFLDPPYEQDLLAPSCLWLEEQQLLRHPALVYIECEARLDLSFIPSHWQIYRDKCSKNIRYCLFKITAPAHES